MVSGHIYKEAYNRIQDLVGEKARVDAGKRLGGELQEAELRLWNEELKL